MTAETRPNLRPASHDGGRRDHSVAEAPSPLRLPRNVWVVTLTSFLTDISTEMLINLLPLFLAGVLGVRTAAIGLIEGVAESSASLLKMLSGWLSDRLGTRKRLAVLGYGLSTVVKPFLYIATTWTAVLAVRFGDRVGKGIRTAPRDALIADSVDHRQRGLAFGLHRAGDTAGAMIGIGIALLVVLAGRRTGVDLDRSTFQTVVLLSMLPAVLAVLVLAVGARDTCPCKGSAAPPRLTLAGLDRRFRLFLAIVALFTLGNSSDAFLILRARNAGLSVAGVLGMMMTFNLVYAIVSSPMGALSDRFGRRRFLVVGWVLYAVVYLGFARATAGWQTWGLMGAYGVYYGMTYGVAKAYVADLVPAEKRGTAYGVYNAVVGVVAFPASLIAGLLWQGFGKWSGFGPSAPFLFGAVLALVAAVLLAAHAGSSRSVMVACDHDVGPRIAHHRS
ncbi:MAG: MFS transporter [Candidatus Eisenbacteria bacterium]|nr:MFS transporter [Candidatus Eisenbacteria bacterium]